MEMAAHEGQRCEKATGKISFLDSPPASYLACLPERSGHIHVFVDGDANTPK